MGKPATEKNTKKSAESPDPPVISREAIWRWYLFAMPLAIAIILLGRVWMQWTSVVGYDQIGNERVLCNAGNYLLHPGAAPWGWPAAAPACLTDHGLGLALLTVPWRLCGFAPVPVIWCTTAVILALNGTLLGWLLRRWGLSWLAAMAAAVLAVGLPVLVQRLTHANNLEMCWVLAWTLAADAFFVAPGMLTAAGLLLAGCGLAVMPGTVLQFCAFTFPILAGLVVVLRRPSGRSFAHALLLQIPGILLAIWVYHPFLTHSYPPNVVIPNPVEDLARPLADVAWSLKGGQLGDSIATPGPVPAIGVIGLILAIAYRHHRALAIAALAVVVVNLICAVSVGSFTLVNALHHLPLFGGLRSPSRFLIPACFAALIGVALLIDLVQSRGKFGFAVALAALAWGGQIAVDGGPAAPLLLLPTYHLPIDAVAQARPGPVLCMPAEVLDDEVARVTGRVTASSEMGIPTEWMQLLRGANDAHDLATIRKILTALHRLGLVGVLIAPGLAPDFPEILTEMGGTPQPCGTELTWYALPPVPPGDGRSQVTETRDAEGRWHVAIDGDLGAPPVEGRIVSASRTYRLVPFLPGTYPFADVFPAGDPCPVVHLDRPLPVVVVDPSKP